MQDVKEQKRITHVIFDCDGLLLDTETVYTECFTAYMNQHGKVDVCLGEELFSPKSVFM